MAEKVPAVAGRGHRAPGTGPFSEHSREELPNVMTVLEGLADVLPNLGLVHSPSTALTVSRVIALVLAIALSIAAYAVARYFLVRRGVRIIESSRSQLASILLERRVLHRLCILGPLVVMYAAIPHVLAGYEDLISTTQRATRLLFALVATLVVDAGLNAALDYYETSELSKKAPLRSVVQASKIIVYLLAGVLTLSLLLDLPLVVVLGTVGALFAVSGFVFHDPILGLVASIRIAANDMVAIGDQIEVPEYHADGEVLEISMTTVKVQNFDKSITTIPTYALVSQAVKNWRGMQGSGGRRIKRAVYIDISTIRFCTAEMLEAHVKLGHTVEYVDRKMMIEIEADGEATQYSAPGLSVEGRITNVDLFQAYVTGYLRNHPGINQDMRVMVRQLAPTPNGLPVEIWAFSRDTNLDNYEAVQSEILSHVLSVVPDFDLKVFQYPAGSDLKELTGRTDDPSQETRISEG
jgi:miniconductance mechanosensitive channel